MTTYEKLYAIVSPKLVNFRRDLEFHDKNGLDKWTGPFLYGYRPTGTTLLKIGMSLEEWFGPEMTYKPMFGEKRFLKDVDDACKVLEDEIVWIVPGADNKWFLHFDGKELKEVTKERAALIWRNYVHSLRMSAPFKMEGSKAITI